MKKSGRAKSTKSDFEDLDDLEKELDAETNELYGDDDEDLDEMSKKQLLAYIKENDLNIKKAAKMDEDELREAIQDSLNESGDEEEGNEEEMEVDLDEMDKKELINFIKENDLDIKKAKTMNEKKLRKAIEAALEELGEESGDEGDEEEMEVDLDEMDKKELLNFIKENDLDIDIKKAKTMNEKKLRKAIEVALEDGGEESGVEESEVDLDEMDKKELINFIKENDLDINLKKAKVMPEKKLRKAIEAAMEELGEESGDEESEVDLDEMDKKELLNFIKENDINIKKARTLTEKKLRKAIEAAMEEAGDEDEPKKPRKAGKADKESSGYLTTKAANLLEKKVAALIKNAEMLSTLLEEGEVTRKGKFLKITKKVKSCVATAAEIDDAIEEISAE